MVHTGPQCSCTDQSELYALLVKFVVRLRACMCIIIMLPCVCHMLPMVSIYDVILGSSSLLQQLCAILKSAQV